MQKLKVDWIIENVLAGCSVPVGIADLESLREQGIRAIVTLTEHPLTVRSQISDEVLREMGFDWLHIPIDDQHPPTFNQVKQMVDFIDQMRDEQRPTVVHCFAGIGRTGTMLHAYLMVNGVNLEEAKMHIRLRKANSQWLMLSDSQRAFLETLAKSLMEKS